MTDSPFLIVLFAIVGGALRVSTPFMFVALGECLTEKSGRVNLGLEGALVLGAMTANATSYHTGSPWLLIVANPCSGSTSLRWRKSALRSWSSATAAPRCF
jgi:simple sugar transport system permease protein